MKHKTSTYHQFTASGDNYGLLKLFCKEHRRVMTDAESVLWEHLKGSRLGCRFRRQHIVNNFIADFISIRHKLIVEVDGLYHSLPEQMIADNERTTVLEGLGFKVLRFTNDEIIGNIDNVIRTIKRNMENIEKSMPTGEQNNAPLLGRGRGRLLIFSAPSGSGKSTIVQWLMQEHPELNMHFSISCTTRAPRGTEQNGVEYFFITPDEFRQKIAENAFVEYEEVYTDKFYGTLKSQVEELREAGKQVVFDIDVKGGCNIKQQFGDDAMSIFIQPPSIEELRRRLFGRATDAPEVIEQRLAKAEFEMTFAPKFDRIVINDDLETAKQEVLAIIREFIALSPTSPKGE